MKYVDEQGQVRTLVTEPYPFKGVENHFTNSLLYQDASEITTQQEDEFESGNEADEEPDSKFDDEDEVWEIELSILGQDNLNYLMQ